MLYSTYDYHTCSDVLIFLASQEKCDDLTSINEGSILYIPPRHVSATLSDGERYVGTIATCASGYQLVGGSVRACVPGGMWNGTEPTCGMLNYIHC